MRSFVSKSTFDPVPAALVRRCRAIDRGSGLEELFQQHHPEALLRLASRARIESVIASSEIEGIVVGRDRAERVLKDGASPNDRDERELAGYQAALDEVFAAPDAPVTVPRILHWHRLLFSHAGPDVAGRFETQENRVIDRLPDGRTIDRFSTVPASETPSMVEQLVARSETMLNEGDHHPVFVTAAFVLDLLTIHPFLDGNGRVARIATTAILLRSGYRVCRYVSLEHIIADRQSEYYRSLAESTAGWHESTHRLWPWAEFLADVLVTAQEHLERQLAELRSSSATELVQEWLDNRAPTLFRISEAERVLPFVSRATILRVLQERRGAGTILKEGRGPSTRWRIVR